ncbi:arabidopsis phospholipase-like protein [Striga asiatica]|uniref:Arabidopsis phospholipase-like protein n=1 Tax=Striga asiatica TaxID=4170 RepID=A0A5A7QL08_STRAF|nr:arabidopsis phospholipase-like protein [Striga asiatica]
MRKRDSATESDIAVVDERAVGKIEQNLSITPLGQLSSHLSWFPILLQKFDQSFELEPARDTHPFQLPQPTDSVGQDTKECKRTYPSTVAILTSFDTRNATRMGMPEKRSEPSYDDSDPIGQKTSWLP